VGRWRSCGWSCGHTRSSSTGPRCPPSPSTVHPPVTPTSSPVCPPVLHRIRARWDGLGGGLGGHSEQLPPSNPQSYPQAVGEYHPSSPIYLVLGVLHRSERPRPGGHDQTCSGTCVQLPADVARSGTPSLIDGEDLACDPPPDWRSVGRSSPPNPTGCGQPLGMTTLGGPRSCGPSLADLTGHRGRIPDRTGEATVDLGRAAARRPGSFQTFENVPNTASWAGGARKRVTPCLSLLFSAGGGSSAQRPNSRPDARAAPSVAPPSADGIQPERRFRDNGERAPLTGGVSPPECGWSAR
jgi:hypothetical protein